jgi:hypothetical protein
MHAARMLAIGAVLIALSPTSALAGAVYLNGVRIDGAEGIRNTRFDKVNVRIDEAGNVFIDAPGYAIKVMDPGSAGKKPEEESEGTPRLTRRYFLVTEQTAPGMAEYDVDVYVNSKWIRKLRGTDSQIYTEITKSLQPGKNTVTLSAKKVAKGARKSFSPEHLFRVIIGEGNVGGDHVMIDRTVVEFQRSAADVEDLTREYTFSTR